MKERIQSFFVAAAAAIDRLANFAVVAAISILLLLLVVWLNPAKLGSFIWMISKLSMAALLGEFVYRAMSRGQDSDDALLTGMRQSQRAVLLAACIVAAGLMA
jgi:hypothetical protein